MRIPKSRSGTDTRETTGASYRGRYSKSSLALMRWLVTSYHGNRLWSTDSWQKSVNLAGSGGIAFSPDSNILAIELGNGIMRLLDPATDVTWRSWKTPSGSVLGLTFTPDGSQLVAANNDSNSIHIWNLRAIRAELAK